MRDGDRRVDGLVACVCRVCNRRFHRRVDHMSISVAESTAPMGAGNLVHTLRTRSDYVLAMGDLCDEHLPDPPEAVTRDAEMEGEKRRLESERYVRDRGIESVPFHGPNSRMAEHPPVISTMETRRPDEDVGIHPDRKWDPRKDLIQDSRDPLKMCRGADPGGRVMIRGGTVDGSSSDTPVGCDSDVVRTSEGTDATIGSDGSEGPVSFGRSRRSGVESGPVGLRSEGRLSTARG